MRELDIEQRLIRIEENITLIRKMLEKSADQKQGNTVPDNEIMSVKRLAHFLGIDATIIYTKCAKNEIPYFKLGRQFRFKKSEIVTWLRETKAENKVSVDDYVERYLQKHVMKS